MDEIKLPVYKQANQQGGSTIEYHIQLRYWLDLIKHGSVSYPQLTDDLKYIRTLERGTQEYKKAKSILLPCISIHSINGRQKKDLQTLSGYILIDIDKELTTSVLETIQPNIIARYTSPGGVGTHIILRVDGMSVEGFNAEYKIIMSELGLNELYDEKMAHPCQIAYISYCPSIYVNLEALPIDMLKLATNSRGVQSYPNTISLSPSKSRKVPPANLTKNEDGLKNEEITAYLEYDQSKLFFEVDPSKKFKVDASGKTYLTYSHS